MYKKRWFMSFVLPAFAIFAIVILTPTILGIVLSFTDWRKGSEMFQDGWIGFDNYKAAFEDGAFVSSIGYTAVYTVVSLVMINVVGFLLALALVRAFKGRNLFRGVFFIPNILGGLILGYLWQVMFDKLFPEIFGGDNMRLQSKWTALMAMAMVSTWKMSGYVMVIYIAALQNIDKNLIEASKIEGAGIFKRFKSVIIPGVMPAITVALFLTLSNSFKMFDMNLSLTEGRGGTDLLSLNIRDSAYNPAKLQTFGIAQAKAVIFTILVSGIALTQVAVTKRMEVEA